MTSDKLVSTPVFKTGDKVKVTRKAAPYEGGWKNTWEDGTDCAVGQIGTVTQDPIQHPLQHDVTVRIDKVGTWGYPDFVLELVESVKSTEKKVEAIGGFHIGDRVQVKKSRRSHFSLSPATVISSNRCFLDIKTDSGKFGSFYLENVELVDVRPEIKPVEPTGRNVFAVAKAITIFVAKKHGAVHVDRVQDGLAKLGYSSADLGNAAGVLFRGKDWKKIQTQKSLRKGNHGRQISVWEYVGE